MTKSTTGRLLASHNSFEALAIELSQIPGMELASTRPFDVDLPSSQHLVLKFPEDSTIDDCLNLASVIMSRHLEESSYETVFDTDTSSVHVALLGGDGLLQDTASEELRAYFADLSADDDDEDEENQDEFDDDDEGEDDDEDEDEDDDDADSKSKKKSKGEDDDDADSKSGKSKEKSKEKKPIKDDADTTGGNLDATKKKSDRKTVSILNADGDMKMVGGLYTRACGSKKDLFPAFHQELDDFLGDFRKASGYQEDDEDEAETAAVQASLEQSSLEFLESVFLDESKGKKFKEGRGGLLSAMMSSIARNGKKLDAAWDAGDVVKVSELLMDVAEYTTTFLAEHHPDPIIPGDSDEDANDEGDSESGDKPATEE